jgi:hypothetical protein
MRGREELSEEEKVYLSFGTRYSPSIACDDVRVIIFWVEKGMQARGTLSLSNGREEALK